MAKDMQTEEPSSHQPTPQSSHQPTPQSSHHPISLSSHQPNPIESSTVQLKVLIMNLCNNHLTWRWMTMLHHQEKLEEGGSKVLYGTILIRLKLLMGRQGLMQIQQNLRIWISKAQVKCMSRQKECKLTDDR